MEFKNLPQFTKGIEGRVVTVICAVFGNVNHGEDRIWPGAFAKTIQERGKSVKHLWNHGVDGFEYFCTPPTAHILELREVMRDELPPVVTERAPDALGGLLVKREYLTTPRGDELLANLAAGVPLEMSFGFDVIKWDWEAINVGQPGEYRLRNLRELRLWDTSDVNFGMNSATTAAGKSLDDRLKVLIDRLEMIMREVKKASALPEAIDVEFQRLATIMKSLGVDNEPEPAPVATPEPEPEPVAQPQPEAESRADFFDFRESLTQADEALRELEAVL